MKDKKSNLRIPSATLNALKEKYATSSNSQALQKCVRDGILHQTLYTKSGRTLSAQATVDAVKADRSPADKAVSVRLEGGAVEFLKEYYKTANTTTALRCCIYDVLNGTAKQPNITYHDSILYMLGQKNPQMLGFLNEVFNDLNQRYDVDNYIEPFCGTANVLLHTHGWKNEHLYDNSPDLSNVLQVIKNYPYEFRLALLNTELNEDTFSKCQAILNTYFSFKSKASERIMRAVAFYFVRHNSSYGKGGSFNKKTSLDGYRRALDDIAAFSKRLKGVDIHKRDALYSLKKITSTKKSLIYIDSPYICTEKYYEINNIKEKLFHSHHALRNLVQKLSQQGNICCISYRITASESMRKKGITDNLICQKLDYLYLNQGFYYRLEQLRNGQVEILLSNVPFIGATPYTVPFAGKEAE